MAEEKKVLLSQSSYINIGVAVLLLAAIVRNESRMTKLENAVIYQSEQITEIKTNRVSSKELVLYLKTIELKIDAIEKTIK